MSDSGRDDRIEALGSHLFKALLADTKGCDWTEVPEAIGLLLKFVATTTVTAMADDPPPGETQIVDRALSERISGVMTRGFTEGWNRPAKIELDPSR